MDFCRIKDQAPMDPVVIESEEPSLRGLGWAPTFRSAFHQTLSSNRVRALG